eukprot:6905026-Alexandrium_andersonii.AAC.1
MSSSPSDSAHKMAPTPRTRPCRVESGANSEVFSGTAQFKIRTPDLMLQLLSITDRAHLDGHVGVWSKRAR